jgi:light-regulated signal transduction histidine kinase (bacteriophytochrome)
LNYRYVLVKHQKLETEKIVNNRTMELSIVNDELRKANETKDKFLTIISHDIKNPLAAAESVSSELIADEQNYSTSEKKELLSIINRTMKHLHTLQPSKLVTTSK